MNGKFIAYALIVAFLGTSATWIKMLAGPGRRQRQQLEFFLARQLLGRRGAQVTPGEHPSLRHAPDRRPARHRARQAGRCGGHRGTFKAGGAGRRRHHRDQPLSWLRPGPGRHRRGAAGRVAHFHPYLAGNRLCRAGYFHVRTGSAAARAGGGPAEPGAGFQYGAGTAARERLISFSHKQTTS